MEKCGTGGCRHFRSGCAANTPVAEIKESNSHLYEDVRRGNIQATLPPLFLKNLGAKSSLSEDPDKKRAAPTCSSFLLAGFHGRELPRP